MGEYYGPCRVTGVHCTRFGCWWSACVRHQAGEPDGSDPPKKESFGDLIVFAVVVAVVALVVSWVRP